MLNQKNRFAQHLFALTMVKTGVALRDLMLAPSNSYVAQHILALAPTKTGVALRNLMLATGNSYVAQHVFMGATVWKGFFCEKILFHCPTSFLFCIVLVQVVSSPTNQQDSRI